MKTFACFIVENRPLRTAKRADKLARFIAKRHSGSEEGYVQIGPYYTSTVPKQTNDLIKQKHPAAWSAPDKYFRKHGTETTIDPHKLIPTQSEVSHDSEVFLKSKIRDKKPIGVFKHGDKHYIVDGHHRWFRDRLLRKPSKISVIDLDK